VEFKLDPKTWREASKKIHPAHYRGCNYRDCTYNLIGSYLH